MNISVVIAALDEEENIANVIKGLRAQTRPPNEIVVVDNESEDNTVEIARAHGARILTYPRPDIRFGNIGLVFQTGVEAAKGDIIVTTGADFTHPPDYLAKVEQYFRENPKLVLLGGPVHLSNPDPLTDFLMGCYNLSRSFWASCGVALFWGGNTSFRKNAFMLTEGYRGSGAHGPVEEWILSSRLSRVGDWLWSDDVYCFTKVAEGYRAYVYAIPLSVAPLGAWAGLAALSGGA
ncbi:hypothetical protein ES703_62096 [subsurface metagenome]